MPRHGCRASTALPRNPQSKSRQNRKNLARFLKYGDDYGNLTTSGASDVKTPGIRRYLGGTHSTLIATKVMDGLDWLLIAGIGILFSIPICHWDLRPSFGGTKLFSLKTLVALMAILALLSVAAVLGLANYLYDGWVCAEKSILFNNQPTVSPYQSKILPEKNWQIIHVDRPPCCLILPLCENCTLRRKGTVTSVMTSSIDIFELIGEEGFSFCDQISVGMSDLASNSVGMTRTKKSKNFVVCNEKRIVTSINTPTETLETYCSE
ncbi:unnamed protein product [Bursaphelenchus xylophilus]|uniref:(pine wood nematode) hypothetical protein n=1 Tax=Bursaphelenchus xylophilus TaxID=6326 RepID=A0A7I8X0Y0_BURXY|nr:unnamed protein product [Bursaphelenchus xylophilus]CAG9129946.1 unnamed protein product [Bursaphelenchus xylophilus]